MTTSVSKRRMLVLPEEPNFVAANSLENAPGSLDLLVFQSNQNDHHQGPANGLRRHDGDIRQNDALVS